MITSQCNVKRLMGSILAVQALALYYCLYTTTIKKTAQVTTNCTQSNQILLPTVENQHIPHKYIAEGINITQKVKITAAINRERTEHLREYCKKYKKEIINLYPDYKNSKTLENGLASFIWLSSPHHKLFYCATPKCGSTTWKSYLMEDLNIYLGEQDTHV